MLSTGSVAVPPPMLISTSPSVAPPTTTVPVAPVPKTVVGGDTENITVGSILSRRNATAFDVDFIAVAVGPKTAVTECCPAPKPGTWRVATPEAVGRGAQRGGAVEELDGAGRHR